MAKIRNINDTKRLQIIIGENIRIKRVELGISQEALANNADIDRSYIGRIENAQVNISLNKLCQIANALNVDILDLIRDDKPKK